MQTVNTVEIFSMLFHMNLEELIEWGKTQPWFKEEMIREVSVEHTSDYDPFGDPEDVIKHIQDFVNSKPGVKISLEEHWSGYEDVDYHFVWKEPETEYQRKHRVLNLFKSHVQKAEAVRLEQNKKNFDAEVAILKRKYNQ